MVTYLIFHYILNWRRLYFNRWHIPFTPVCLWVFYQCMVVFWLGLGGTSSPSSSNPLLRAGLPTSRSDCPGLPPACLENLQGWASDYFSEQPVLGLHCLLRKKKKKTKKPFEYLFLISSLLA